MDALEALIPELDADDSIRAIVIRGAGEEHFSVGMDLKQLPEGVKRMGSIEAVFDQRLRVLAAAEGAMIGLPEMELGAIPAWGGSARLTKCVGRDHALDLILRAKKISGPEALRIGLVNEVWPNHELQARAQALAQELAAMPALAVGKMIECIVGLEDAPLEEALAAERRAVMATLGTTDQQEGMRAFLEKRRPVFNQG
jgi:enoyl-CoA hydratase